MRRIAATLAVTGALLMKGNIMIIRTLVIAALLMGCATTVFAESPRFSAACKTSKSMFVWYGLDINNKRIERWSENGVDWTFDYNGEDEVLIDGKNTGFVVQELKDTMVFIWATNTSSSLSFYSFAVNFRSSDIVVAEVNTASDFAGTQNKGGVWKLDCNFY